MIARFRMVLPTRVVMRSSDNLQPHDVLFQGRRARIYPPFQAARTKHGALDLDAPPMEPPIPGDATVEGKPTFVADTVQVDVHGEFDRRDDLDGGDVTAIALPVLRQVLARFRSVSGASFVASPGERSTWSLRYLTDAGEDFEKADGVVRGRGSAAFNFELQAWLAPEVWDDLKSAVDAPPPPPSDELLLDAQQAWPHVGASIALAHTAIEVAIATALDVVAGLNSAAIGPAAWQWFTHRDDYRNNPSVAEELSDVLELLTGKSLKKEQALWQHYVNLRKARNGFMHGGRAVLSNGVAVSAEKAQELINGARTIVDWIEALLPEQHRRPQVPTPQRPMTRVIRIA